MKIFALALILLLSPFTPLKAKPLRIYAAASLTEVLQKIAEAYETKEKILFNFDASSKLAHQINSGAPSDLFFSADTDWMDFLQKNDRLIPSSRRDLLSNQIVLILPVSSPNKLNRVTDLLDESYERIALAGEAVPAGKFARSALKSEGLDPEKIKKKIVTADNVKIALKWVSLKEASAGIVYKTDAMADPQVKVVFTFKESSHPKIIYPAAVINQSPNQGEALKFLEFCRSEKAKGIFQKAGFITL